MILRRRRRPTEISVRRLPSMNFARVFKVLVRRASRSRQNRSAADSSRKKLWNLRSAFFVLPARSEGTRLNSSHSQISYAVFCLKKKKKQESTPERNQKLQSVHSPQQPKFPQ